MAKDNTALAQFITSFGSMNNYKSSVLQTKRALDLNNISRLKNPETDGAIFNDALAGIAAAKDTGFSADGIIAINKSFTNSEAEDPKWPGHLRSSKFYNPDDSIVIITDPNGSTRDAYYAPADVTKADLERIVDQFNHSEKTKIDAWRVFAQISKLQPFQDGNKRTGLITANSAYNTWQNEDYLVLPFNSIDHAEFMLNLMRYYLADGEEQEEQAFQKMIAVLPSSKEVRHHIDSLDGSGQAPDLRTKRVKYFYRN